MTPLFWVGAPVVLIVACVAIGRWQRRGNSWLDRVDEIRRVGR